MRHPSPPIAPAWWSADLDLAQVIAAPVPAADVLGHLTPAHLSSLDGLYLALHYVMHTSAVRALQPIPPEWMALARARVGELCEWQSAYWAWLDGIRSTPLHP